ncbi:MAG: glycosyltransferase family 4 protein, partial [Planctomycetota bacterium]
MPEGTIIIFGSRLGRDHLAGVPELLRRRGFDVACERMWGPEIAWGGHAIRRQISRAACVVNADLTLAGHVRVARLAAASGVPSVLMVDGVLEWANTYMNPWLGKRYLRPAPHSTVIAPGPLFAGMLRQLGNDCVEIGGLPRLAGFAGRIEQARADARAGPIPTGGSCAEPPTILVATANVAWRGDAWRDRIIASLRRLLRAADDLGVAVRWRIAPDLARALSVEADQDDIAASMARSNAVICAASTVAIEAMIAGLPTCVLHPHPWPCWVPAAWRWAGTGPGEIDPSTKRMLDGSAEADSLLQSAELAPVEDVSDDDPSALLKSLLGPLAAHIDRQAACLAAMHADNPAERVADALERAARQTSRSGMSASVSVAEPFGVTRVAPPPKRAMRVVSVLARREGELRSPLAVSRGLGAELPVSADTSEAHTIEAHTLHVLTRPISYADAGVPGPSTGPNTHMVTLEPTHGTHEHIEAIRAACAALEPDVVLVHDDDRLHCAAALVAANTGATLAAIAHGDDWHCIDRLTRLDAWDLAIATNDTAARSLRRQSRDRPVTTIPYGVQIPDAPRGVPDGEPDGEPGELPMRIVWVGSAVQESKRVLDTIPVLRMLRDANISFRFHLIGDGPDLNRWNTTIREHGLERCCRAHGALSAEATAAIVSASDVILAVSASEGASISLQEAMGRGVVPAITDFSGPVAAWVTDGLNGVKVPVRNAGVMAGRLASLARNPDALRLLGSRAHATAKAKAFTTRSMARAYADLLKTHHEGTRGEHARLARDTRCWLRSDRPLDLKPDAFEPPRSPDHPEDADRWAAEALGSLGFARVSRAEPTEPRDACDAVLIGASDPMPSEQTIAAWRADGVGVAISPNLRWDEDRHAVDTAIDRLRSDGAQRIAVAPAGRFTHAVIPAIERGEPIAGFIDNERPQGGGETITHAGLPVWHPHGLPTEAFDAVLLAHPVLDGPWLSVFADAGLGDLSIASAYRTRDQLHHAAGTYEQFREHASRRSDRGRAIIIGERDAVMWCVGDGPGAFETVVVEPAEPEPELPYDAGPRPRAALVL